MAKDYNVSILLTAKDEASKKITALGEKVKSLGKGVKAAGAKVMSFGATVAKAGVAAGAAVAGTAALTRAIAVQSDKVIQTRKDFESLAKSLKIDTREAILKLTEATDGLVSKTDLMVSSNKLMKMGLAENSDEMAMIAKMAVRLGDQTQSATDRISDFALMMANQSIPRLDNFGISSGRVRKRIEELMKADKKLTREEAFKIAVMEEGRKSLLKLGDAQETAGRGWQRMQANFKNMVDDFMVSIQPIVDAVSDVFGEVFDVISEYMRNIDFGKMSKNFADWFKKNDIAGKVGDFVAGAIDGLGKFFNFLGKVWGQIDKFAKKLGGWGKIWDTIKSILNGVWNVFKGFGKAIKWVFDTIAGGIEKSNEFNSGGENMKGTFENLKDVFDQIVGVLKTVKDWFVENQDAIENIIAKVVDLTAKLIHFISWIIKVGFAIGEFVVKAITKFEEFKKKVGEAFTKLKDKAEELKRKVIRAFLILYLKAKKRVILLRNKIRKYFILIKRRIKNSINDAINKAKKKFDDFKEKVRKVKDKIIGWFSGIGTTMKEGLKKALNGVIDIVNRYIRKVNSFATKVQEKTHIHIPTIPTIQKLATGGIVKSDWQIVGENGPELVSLPRGTRVYSNNETQKMLSQEVNQSVTININGYNKDPQELANEIIRLLADKNQLGKYNLF